MGGVGRLRALRSIDPLNRQLCKGLVLSALFDKRDRALLAVLLDGVEAVARVRRYGLASDLGEDGSPISAKSSDRSRASCSSVSSGTASTSKAS